MDGALAPSGGGSKDQHREGGVLSGAPRQIKQSPAATNTWFSKVKVTGEGQALAPDDLQGSKYVHRRCHLLDRPIRTSSPLISCSVSPSKLPTECPEDGPPTLRPLTSKPSASLDFSRETSL